MAVAPSLPLLGVPSRARSSESMAACSSAERPRSNWAMCPLTCSTAVKTPLPPNWLASLSRSSRASWAPVEAPEGTSARPRVPSSRRTSTSTVGLPRESRIWRARTSAMRDTGISILSAMLGAGGLRFGQGGRGWARRGGDSVGRAADGQHQAIDRLDHTALVQAQPTLGTDGLPQLALDEDDASAAGLDVAADDARAADQAFAAGDDLAGPRAEDGADEEREERHQDGGDGRDRPG